VKRRTEIEIVIFFLAIFAFGENNDSTIDPLNTAVKQKKLLSIENKIKQFEPKHYKEFKFHQSGKRATYWCERKIGEAFVEKDIVNYQFDIETGNLIKVENQRDGALNSY
jgi:hypothetical protein